MSNARQAIALAMVAAVVMLTATHQGVGVGPDSVWYFQMADGTRHTTHFAPGYPWLLRVLDARAIAVASYAVIVGVGAFLGGPLAALLLLTTPRLTYVASWAMSEAPFVVAVLVFVAALARERYWMAALAAAVMILLRHAGIAAIPVLAFFAYRDGWRRSGVLIPPLVAAVTVPSARVYGWHPAMIADWWELGKTVVLTVVPLMWPWVVVGCVPVAFAFASRQLSIRVPNDRFTRACLLWMLSYSAVIILARYTADIAIPFDGRMFAPVTVVGLVLVARGVRMHTRFATISLATFLMYRALVTATFVISVSQTGQSYGSREWRDGVQAMMREVGDGEVIVTNDRDGLSWLTHHPVTALPYLPNARTRDSLIADAVHSANRDHATVLFFRTITPALWYSFPESAFVRACGCRPDTTFGIGAVYRMH